MTRLPRSKLKRMINTVGTWSNFQQKKFKDDVWAAFWAVTNASSVAATIINNNFI